MCGIAGLLAGGRDAEPMLEKLLSGLEHRGPDGRGIRYFAGRAAALGHRRLSIVDLETGAQPMSNEDGSLWVTYNGELYNHLELRRELEDRGHRFATTSDTETLIHGWEEWGRDVLRRMNGIYAFGLIDARRGEDAAELWLARDPVGVKPLYLGRHAGTWWFASELAAARSAGFLDSGFRLQAVDEFLVYRFIPSPGTFYRNAWKLPPGHLCRLALREPSAEPVFLPFRADFAPAVIPDSSEEWEEAIRLELRRAVHRQLMSDVPVGSLLSGGVDSTVVTRFMREGLPRPPQAFAIGFAEAPDGGELANARRAAAELGVPLQEVAVQQMSYRELWPEEVRRFGEPVANSGALMLGMLCHAVGKTHKVVLSGQGADEPLGGYPRHAGERWYPLSRRLRPLLGVLPERMFGGDRVSRMRRLAAEPDEARRFTSIFSVFAPDEAVALTGHRIEPDALTDPVRRWIPAGNGGDSLNRLLYVDARLSLADDLLIVADWMSMKHSVELRVPFLDLQFLQLLEQMPGRYKVSPLGERKWLYRRAVQDLLPPGLRGPLLGWRERTGRKLGFTTPLDRWFDSWVAGEGRDFLGGTEARLPDFLDPTALRRELDQAGRGGRHRIRQVMSLFVLESWLRGAA